VGTQSTGAQVTQLAGRTSKLLGFTRHTFDTPADAQHRETSSQAAGPADAGSVAATLSQELRTEFLQENFVLGPDPDVTVSSGLGERICLLATVEVLV
jgi:hypothetical protein